MTLNEAITDEAIQRAGDHADGAWMRAVMARIKELAAFDIEFTTDAVWEYMETHHEETLTHEPRAMGAAMRTAKSRGLCHPTGRYVKTARRQAHGRPVAVWRTTSPKGN
tara:strand:- start:4719 stop:5045 length:327 start_codon:yes stop_codon:yes gene_type:complete